MPARRRLCLEHRCLVPAAPSTGGRGFWGALALDRVLGYGSPVRIQTKVRSNNLREHLAESFVVVCLACLTAPVVAQDQIPSRDAVADLHTQDEFSPYAGREYPTEAFWGDSHVHTSISVDAGTMTRLGQEDAFRFARGEEVVATGGLRAKLGRPLDWIVIAGQKSQARPNRPP